MIPYYQRNGITIYCGETLEVMAYLYEALRTVFDAIIADLPYGTTACSWDTVIPFEPLWENYKRLIKENGAVVLFGSEPFSSLLRVSNLGWYKYDWVWRKSITTGFQHAKNKPLKAHESVSVFSRGTTNHEALSKTRMVYNPQMKRGNPYKKVQRTPNVGNGSMHNASKINLDYVGTVKDNKGVRYPNSVLDFPMHNHKLHPTQKPVALLQYLIRTYTNPGEIVLDNTAGSFTTAVACIREGRRFVGIEKDENYCRIGKERIIEALLASGNVQASCDTIGTRKSGYQLGLPLQDYQIPEKV